MRFTQDEPKAYPAQPNPLILFVAALPPPVHGQSAATLSILQALQAEGVNPVVIDTSPGSLQRSISYHLRRIRATFRAAREIFGAQRHRGPKRLYTVMESGWGQFYSVAIITSARISGFELYIHHHTAAHSLNYRALTDVATRIAGKNATHVALSDAMSADLRTKYRSARRFLVCQNAILIEPGHRRKLGSPPLTVGILSNLSQEKGLVAALEAFYAARAEGLIQRLILAGPASDPRSEEIITQASVSADVTWLGPVHGHEKEQFFQDIDAFFFPTLYRNEAQPLVLLEALSRGIPIIANGRGYIPELVANAGALATKPEEFTGCALEALHGWKLAPATLAAASEAAAARFDYLRVEAQGQMAQLLRELVATEQRI